ncbi:disease resistance protein RUN1 isoform X2 [Arachis duranensis]|uniref:ADP-ribosyl cyclase/cyclic ADP-ribose hydrolase n=1 Tax=Arachis duranensis TaxID=130453 RepID=A0A9C6WST4_ARADU|nr:disease resistance protein RUN1 isoform X2 [Arachis duranensis]
MASASSSTSIPLPSRRSCTYDVFLSFRGEDTRTGFTGHLYAALNRKGITTYKDDKNLRKGHVISKELLKAIEESMFAVIVFSPDYASSSWCLDELQKIIECKNQLGLQIEAVFYGVEPCDVRHQRGTFEEAFNKHEQRHDREKVKRWKDALTEVAAHSGWTSKNQDEAVLVENITQHIFEILIPKLPSSMKNLVGINSRVEQVITLIGLGLNDVRFIAIWGMGGMGKTTIARAVFDIIQSRFEVTCFLYDVRDRCEKKDITHIQKQLLKQMNISSNVVHDKEEWRRMIKNSLHLKKVLLVLDDVNHEKQLENLAGEKDWFGPGSRIIMTTRDFHMLRKNKLHETYNVEGLVEREALNLFSLEAFNLPKPSEEFLDLSKEVVKYSGGLPLALKVLGSYLNGRPIAVWHSAIKRIKKSSHSEIIDVLKISYMGLEDTEKNIFLDIACFFKGWPKDYATEILERCGHDAEIGIDILINRSLVTIHQNNTLGMHDLLEEMGKQIVIQKSPNDTCKHSRLWCLEDVEFVLTQKKETEAIHSIVLHKVYRKTEVNQRDLSFSKMCQLKLLVLDFVEVPILCDIPCTLKVLEKLEYLDLSGCRQLKQTPDLSRAPNLKKLDLWGCKELDYIHRSLAHHKRLVELKLSECRSLKTLGEKLEMSSLEILDLSDCSRLRRLPDLSGAPNLKTLDLDGCEELNYFHPSLAHHKRLVDLNLRGCGRLETLGDKLEMSSLERLDLESCSSLRRLPEFGDCMKQLSIPELRYTGIEGVPTSLGSLAGMSELDLSGCDNITGLPLSLGCFVGLKKLVLSRFVELSCLPHKTHGLESLKVEDFSDSTNIVGFLRSLPCLTSLSSLTLSYDIGSSREESTLSYDIAHLASLTHLDLSHSSFLRVPISIHQLPRLTCLKLSFCDELEVLPELPSSLRELNAECCYSLDASNVDDVISKACCGFAESASQDREDILQMLIPGKEIPAWFEHQEQDEGVSLSFPLNCPSTEMVALALCFLFDSIQDLHRFWPKVICNGKEFINATLYVTTGSDNLFIVCVNGYYFSKLLCQHNRFQMLFPVDIRVKRCGARWVCKQDIQEFKKRRSQTGKRKATLELNMDMIPHSSTSRNKMLVVAPQLNEQEEERAVTAEGPIRHLASRKSSDPPELLPLFPLHPSSHSS